MSELSLAEKRRQIFDNETAMANQLARTVIEKPVPPVWMVLVPIFFVFYAWKVKQYSNALKDFAKHYLISRNRALDAAFEAIQHCKPPEIAQLVKAADSISAEAKPLYRSWISLLVNHYHCLLAAPGKSHYDLIRSHYQSKSSYLLFCNQLNNTEYAYNKALLPTIEGDQNELGAVLKKMKQGMKDHYQKQIKEIF